MGERMEKVEVLYDCDECGGWPDSSGCGRCGGGGKAAVSLPVAPHSLTAARLRLADAAEAWMTVAHTDTASAMEAAFRALRTARGA